MRFLYVIFLVVTGGATIGGAAIAQQKPKPLWTLVKTVDKMSDEQRCLLAYSRNPYVYYNSRDVMVVSFRGRGGVAYYQYRIDKRPAAEPVLTRRDDNDDISIFSYDDMLNASMLRIQGQTVLKQLIDVEIDLTGLALARDQMAKSCGLEPVQQRNAPWPAVPPEASGGK
jgi:hypothetical protein